MGRAVKNSLEIIIKQVCLEGSIEVSPSPPYTYTEGNCSNKVQHARTPLPAPHPQEVKQADKMTTSTEPVTLNNKKHNRTHSEDVSLVHVINGYH